jgi:hypothetical protein
VGQSAYRPNRSACVSRLTCLAACFVYAASACAQPPLALTRMVANEIAAEKQQPLLFSYSSEERSTRTGGHLWKENVVETSDGLLRRLVSVDGQLLTTAAAAAEECRITSLIEHPDKLRKLNETRRGDEPRTAQLLNLLPKAFLFSPAGEREACTTFAFRPNPAFSPATIEERIVATMEGTISIKEPVDRMCSVEARITKPVKIGFGLLGRVNAGGRVSIVRALVNGSDAWKTSHLSIHVDGRIVMFKSLSQDMESARSGFYPVPQHRSQTESSGDEPAMRK